jgi:hypothetical protein
MLWMLLMLYYTVEWITNLNRGCAKWGSPIGIGDLIWESQFELVEFCLHCMYLLKK